MSLQETVKTLALLSAGTLEINDTRPRISVIYLDVDEVLVDWVSDALASMHYDVVAVSCKWAQMNPRPWDLCEVIDVDPKTLWACIERDGAAFWKYLNKFPWADDLFAAFIVEPIQGEAGVVVPPDGYLKAARELCTRYGALLADEIQTGLGRTGYLFACEHDGVVPDIMCLAKSLSGGLVPIGACIATEEVWDRAYGGLDRALLHPSTFGGNAWPCAAGIASLQVILEEDLTGSAAANGSYFLDELRKLLRGNPMIKEVRGRGLLIGIEFEKPAHGGLGARLPLMDYKFLHSHFFEKFLYKE